MNTVRKHLSAIHGGRLAAATRARVLALIVSDVTGDDPTHIGSGPCAPDPTTYADALAIVARYGVDAPPAVRAHLERGARGEIAETPKPGDRTFARVENRVVATAQSSLQAAARVLESAGITAAVLGDSVTGEASEVAKVYGALVRQVRRHAQPFRPPVALISGGECTVTVRGRGRGGRCSEFLLALAIDLDGEPDVHAIAADTDGIDGSEDNAGALLDPDSLARARQAGLDPRALAAGNDAYAFFAGLDQLVTTGPTRTNVNDYRAILIL
jgi:hydroxypyruvate reductase